MTYEQLRWQQEISEMFPEQYETSYIPIFYVNWNDYEEHGAVFILEKDGKLYEQNYRYSVMSDDNTPKWQPQEISFGEAIMLIEEWEEISSTRLTSDS